MSRNKQFAGEIKPTLKKQPDGILKDLNWNSECIPCLKTVS